MANLYIRYPSDPSIAPSGTQDVNLIKVGGSTFTLGQQLSANSLPVVLTAAQLSTLTPLTSVAVTQATASSLNATVVGNTAAGSGAATGLVTVQGNASGTPIPVSFTSSGTQAVNLSQVGGTSFALGQQLSTASLPVVLTAAQLSTLTPLTSVAVTQATASSLNATVVGNSAAGSGAATGLVTIQGNASGTPVPVSGTITITPSGTQAVNLSQVSGTSFALGQQLAAASLPVVLTAAQLSTLTPLSSVTVTQATAANLNATVTGTVAATQSGTWNITNISGTVSLPTGAATSANQTTLGSQTSKINDGTNTATVKAASTAAVAGDTALVVAVSPNNTLSIAAPTGRAKANTPVVTTYSSTNVTSAAYVQLVASTTSAVNMIEIFDSSGVALYFATGAAASEVNQFVIYPGGNGQVNFAIPASTRISVKAVSTSATSGTGIINLYT